MTDDEARAILERHNGCGRAEGQDSLLDCLRPYSGVHERHLHEIMAAMITLSSGLAGRDGVDLRAIHDVQRICTMANWWALDPTGMLQRNGLIEPADLARLRGYVRTIESTFLGLTNGQSMAEAMIPYADFLASGHSTPYHNLVLPVLVECLDSSSSNKREIAVCAIGQMGAEGGGAAEALRRLAVDSDPEVRTAANQALQQVLRK